MRQFNNTTTGFVSPGVNNYADNTNYSPPPPASHTTQHQQQQVNQLLRGASQETGEFYLHDPPSQRRNWGQPEPPRTHWNNTKYVTYIFIHFNFLFGLINR